MNHPVLFFTCDFDERAAWEVEQKGFFEHASVRLPNGVDIQVSFWDPIRLSQDLETDFGRGEICFAELGLIIVPAVTVDNMKAAIAKLSKEGYFERLLTLNSPGSNR